MQAESFWVGDCGLAISLRYDKVYEDEWSLEEMWKRVLQVPGWTQERLFLVTGKQIRMVDTTTGAQIAVWP